MLLECLILIRQGAIPTPDFKLTIRKETAQRGGKEQGRERKNQQNEAYVLTAECLLTREGRQNSQELALWEGEVAFFPFNI